MNNESDLIEYIDKTKRLFYKHFDTEVALFRKLNLEECDYHENLHFEFKEDLADLTLEMFLCLLKH